MPKEKLIIDYNELEKYLQSEEMLEKLISHCSSKFTKVEQIAQKLRSGNIDSTVEYSDTVRELSGIYTYINKISKALYSHAQNEKNKALLKNFQDYCDNPWTANEKKVDKEGQEKVNKKVITYSSTISKAQAEKESYAYFKVANYFNAYKESIEQMLLTLGSQAKLVKSINKITEDVEPEIVGD